MEKTNILHVDQIEKIYAERNGVCGPGNPNGIEVCNIIQLRNGEVYKTTRDLVFTRFGISIEGDFIKNE